MIASTAVTAPAVLVLNPKCLGLQSVETIHGWMPKRLRRTDISQTHKRLESLRRQCPQAIWSLGAAFKEMNHHLHAQKLNLTSHLLYKNIKRTFGFFRDLRRADYWAGALEIRIRSKG
ncbi:hypothetical protein DQ393_10360 [Rhizobium tropici]|uniref:Uncharacterized protein n=1 Tax=Rhizobium tropici TaxID=398 RepID=A0A329YL35_RHITR|nr:hypothetical protein DQ393_10360 [Rhizobium tropici]